MDNRKTCQHQWWVGGPWGLFEILWGSITQKMLWATCITVWTTCENIQWLFFSALHLQVKALLLLLLGMHNIYRTDKLSTDMCENYVIFIAPINKWNPISRSEKVCLLVNQSISLIYLKFIHFPSASDCSFKLQWLSACVALITSSFVNMSSLVWKFFSVAEENNGIAICNACSARIPREGKKQSSFNTTNLISHLKGHHPGEAVLREFKQPPLLER